MWSCIGYFLVGSKSGGVMYQPWTFRPSGDVYHISVTSPSFLPARMSSLTFVSCFTCVGLARSYDTMSGGIFGEVSTPTALPLAMLDVVSICTPLVTV